MKKAHFIVFDTETGGFDEAENPILEIAMIALDGETLEEKGRLEMLIKPYDDLVVEKQALKVNGLVMADIMQNGLTKQEAFKEINNFIKKLNPKGNKFNRPIMVGHNVQFDMAFMEMFYYFNKESNFYDYVSRTFCCTMVDTKRISGTERLDLTSVCEYFGIELSNAHKAMPDTEATAEVFKKITMRLRNTSTKNTNSSKDEKIKSRVKFQF